MNYSKAIIFHLFVLAGLSLVAFTDNAKAGNLGEAVQNNSNIRQIKYDLHSFANISN